MRQNKLKQLFQMHVVRTKKFGTFQSTFQREEAGQEFLEEQ